MNLSIYIYMENECQKIIAIWSISIGIFVSFENIFCRLFNLVFTNNIHENSVGKTFLGYSYHLCGIKEYTYISFAIHNVLLLMKVLQPLSYLAEQWDMLHFDLELSKMFQPKPNQTVLFLFPSFPARINLCCLQRISLN